MKFFVVGLGSIGARHARNLIVLGHEVCGYDTNPKPMILPSNAALLPGLTLVDDWKRVMEQNINGCIIATPTVQHAADLHHAIDLGWHTLVEKPIAHELLPGVLNDLEYAEETHIKIVMGNNLRFHPSARLARRYIQEGAIGDPIWASIVVAQLNNKPDYLRDGVTLNWGAHEIDLARWLLGPAKVTAAAINNWKDTVAQICLLHENGCRSYVYLDYLTDPEMRQTVIVGDKGRLVISLTGRYVVLQVGDKALPADMQGGDFDEDYQAEMTAFVNAIQGKTWPGATGYDGYETLKIIHAAKRIAK